MDRIGPRYDQQTQIADQVRSDRLHQLFHQSVSAVFGSYLAALMLCWLCWDNLDHNVVFSWIALLSVSSLLRLGMFIAYFRSPDLERTPQRWELIYWLTLVLSAGIWGRGTGGDAHERPVIPGVGHVVRGGDVGQRRVLLFVL